MQVDSKWPNPHLKVCFTSSQEQLKHRAVPLRSYSRDDRENFEDLELAPLDSELKELIQTAVEKNFSVENTGITFEGWKDCVGDEELAIFYVLDVMRDPWQERVSEAGSIGIPSSFSATSIRIDRSDVAGYRSENIAPSLRTILDWYDDTNLERKNWIAFEQYAFVKHIVHEFGHVAGLAHEHLRLNFEELKKFDISPGKNASVLLQERNENYPAGIEFGRPNPLSTMGQLRTWYEIASEKSRLLCEMSKGKNLRASLVAHLKKLPPHFCEDLSYLAFSPKVQFEEGHLLDLQSQRALLSVYANVPFEDSLDEEQNLLDYVENVWGKMTELSW